jgi:hypothetical protein
MIHEHFEGYLVRTTSFSNKHQRRKFGKPNNLPEIFAIENSQGKYDIQSIRRCSWNVATYKWNVQNGKIEIISFVVKCRS